MRSIPYMAWGHPQNLDDCLDLARHRKVHQVTFRLKAIETVTEQYMLKRLVSIYQWDFKDRQVTIDVIYGGVFLFETEGRQQVSVDNANRRLGNDLAALAGLGIPVNDGGQRFSYTCCYSPPGD